jgi:hypothetical protein
MFLAFLNQTLESLLMQHNYNSSSIQNHENYLESILIIVKYTTLLSLRMFTRPHKTCTYQVYYTYNIYLH